MKMAKSDFSNPEAAWNERYGNEGYIFGKEPNAYLASHAALLSPGQRALLVADGEGRNGVWCAQLGLTVDAFDVSPVGIVKARQLADERGVSVNLNLCGYEDWPWTPETYHVVVVVFAHFAKAEKRQQLFANYLRTLKPGGLLIMQGYTPKQLEFKTGGPSDGDLLLTEALLRESFAAMEILECVSYEAEISEGTFHVGMSALMGFVGRKRST